MFFMYDTILFDLDGTLSDSAEGIINCVQYALEHMGIEAPREELYCFVGPPLKQMFIQKLGMDTKTAGQAQSLYRERFSTVGIRENRMYDGVDELLQKLRAAGARLAVATSKPTKFSTQIVESYGIMPYFDVVLGSEFDGRRHSKAEVIKDVLEMLAVSDPSTVVMVGDRSYDVAGAAECGIDCIGVYYGYAEPGELEAAGAVKTVGTVRELGQYLLGQMGGEKVRTEA